MYDLSFVIARNDIVVVAICHTNHLYRIAYQYSFCNLINQEIGIVAIEEHMTTLCREHIPRSRDIICTSKTFDSKVFHNTAICLTKNEVRRDIRKCTFYNKISSVIQSTCRAIQRCGYTFCNIKRSNTKCILSFCGHCNQ